MQQWKVAVAAVALGTAGSSLPAIAAQAPARPQVVTLGTGAGPLARIDRAQPATLLRWGQKIVLVDAGDGAPTQLVKAGVPFGAVDTIVLTHLHADHTGGLFAFLAMRYQLMLPPLTIYGPPGTAKLVTGLTQGMGPLSELSLAPGRARDPAGGVTVHEISEGAQLSIKGVPLKVAANTHYLMDGKSPDPSRILSLSLRFDFPGRSVVLTGDTGPSTAVVELAKGADLLVSELIDPDEAMAEVRGLYPEMPQQIQERIVAHFIQQHLTTAELGKLAQAAGVKRLVVTHAAIARGQEASAKSEIAARYKGPITIASDLQQF